MNLKSAFRSSLASKRPEVHLRPRPLFGTCRFGVALTQAVILISRGEMHSTPTKSDGEHAVPKQWHGTWQISSVYVDGETLRRLRYQRDDPRLVGRMVQVAATEIRFGTPEHDRCREPIARHEAVEARQLIASGIPGGRLSTPARFGLPVPDSATLDVVRLSCASGFAGPDHGSGSAAGNGWFQFNKRLYLRGYDGTILALSPVTYGMTARPSFDCLNARKAAEQAICGSLELAAYDRSVAKAFASRLQLLAETADVDGAVDLRAEQKAWLKTRDACESRAQCLIEVMESRLEALVEPRDG